MVIKAQDHVIAKYLPKDSHIFRLGHFFEISGNTRCFYSTLCECHCPVFHRLELESKWNELENDNKLLHSDVALGNIMSCCCDIHVV